MYLESTLQVSATIVNYQSYNSYPITISFMYYLLYFLSTYLQMKKDD